MIDKEIAKKLLSSIDLTTLSITDRRSSVGRMIEKVNGFKKEFKELPNVASICLFPSFAKQLVDELKCQEVSSCVVAALFPASQGLLEVKLLECQRAVEAGVDEIDIVFPLGLFLDGEYGAVEEELRRVREVTSGVVLKVILESSLYSDRESLYRAAMIAMESGADFIKTSTGKVDVGATVEAAAVMNLAIADYYKSSARKVGFKASGGISNPEGALQYWSIVESTLGEEWLNRDLFRIGASRLANSLLSLLNEKKIDYF